MVERLPVHFGVVGGNIPREVVAHRVGRDLGAVEAPLHVYALVHGFVDAHAQAHARARRVAHERGGDAPHEIPVAGAVGNVEQKGVRTAPAGKPPDILDHLVEAGAYLPEDLVAVTFAEALVDHVEMVHVDEGRVHVQILVEKVELLGVAVEVLARVEAGDGVALRVLDDLPVLVELHGAADAGQDDFGVGIALGDEVACAEFQALDFGVLLARHDNDGDLAQFRGLLQGAEHVLAAEARHVQVQKHEGDGVPARRDRLECLGAVCTLQGREFFPDYCFQNVAVYLLVVNNKDFRLHRLAGEAFVFHLHALLAPVLPGCLATSLLSSSGK